MKYDRASPRSSASGRCIKACGAQQMRNLGPFFCLCCFIDWRLHRRRPLMFYFHVWALFAWMVNRILQIDLSRLYYWFGFWVKYYCISCLLTCHLLMSSTFLLSCLALCFLLLCGMSMAKQQLQSWLILCTLHRLAWWASCDDLCCKLTHLIFWPTRPPAAPLRLPPQQLVMLFVSSINR